MDTLKFNIRDACGDDIPFIYATWLESYRYDSYFGKSHRNGVFFSDYRKVIDKLLNDSKVIVACVQDEPGAILGYMVFEPSVLHYVFVKGAFRRLGVATGLCRHAFVSDAPLTFTHKTYTCLPIIEKTDRLTYRGTALLKKQGETNGET